ncbi:histidinol-phosphatase (PHP family) [Alkalibacterium subtropicum]|uniref:Histidinol-phosphatase n=1 Tax=Alkalibacterium subtropicum TaxID=753702 RepID=A0A1I1HDB4_9LACT|nr:histidinol-phosphatase HisJ [Alkalibacterium subtropicum]SFC21695.1 histidinol-phosphatase (PHP family) [Alkalibacterium subtropicum]
MTADNHVHTHFCPHGSDDEMEAYVKTAISKGLNQLTFTEHAPLPIEDTTPLKDSAMRSEDVEVYLKRGKELKEKYAEQITINTGFEIDYIEGKEEATKTFLQRYPETVPHSLLSVHFLKMSEEDYFCIDYGKDEFLKKMNDTGYEKLAQLYEETLLKALSVPFGKWTPKRIGHITLINKFSEAHDHQDIVNWEGILEQVKHNRYDLDYNFAGLDKPFYKKTYPDEALVKRAVEKGIRLIYGSDAHEAKDTGRYFERGMNDE